MSISIVLFDRFESRNNLLPLVATRPVGNLRVGAFTLDQKWAKLFESDVSFLTEDYLSAKFSLNISSDQVLVINATVLPNSALVKQIRSLQLEQILVDSKNEWIAFLTSSKTREDISAQFNANNFDRIVIDVEYKALTHLEDIFTYNAEQIEFDSLFLDDIRNHYPTHDINTLGTQLNIADSAVLSKDITLDSTKGAIIILENAIIEPGSVIHGPAVIGENSRVKSGTVIYPNVTIGPNCTISGELNNTVIWGNSAKGHYGYLGCAVIGEGCNLGAGTSNSNLKNDWNTVKLYSYRSNNFRNTGLLKCGVFIGDHSMLGISSKVNTGTVIGVGAQIAISNFIPKFVPDYSWMSDSKTEAYDLDKFQEMMERKSQIKNDIYTSEDKEILAYIYKQTNDLRNN